MRTKLGVVVACYAAVVLLSAGLLFMRHIQEARNAAEVSAASGMWAGGDLILDLFIIALFALPTFLLMLVLRKSEEGYTIYAKALLVLSLTAPVCALGSITSLTHWGDGFLWPVFYRFLTSPMIIVGLMLSWFFAPFRRARRLILYALGIEGGTFIVVVVFCLFMLKSLSALH